MNTIENTIPDAMTDAAAIAIEDLRTQVQLGLCSSKDIAEAALKSAHVGELLAALEDLLGDGCDIHRGVCMRCGRDYLASDGEFRTGENCDADDCPGVIARAAIARAKGEA